MAPGIIGKKIGMTQIFNEERQVIPCTVLQAGPCVVLQRKTEESDGYEAVQMGLVEFVKEKNVSAPMKGHFKKAEAEPCRMLKEFRVGNGSGADLKVGDRVLASDFAAKEKVDAVATSKGRGFAGTVKRHGFALGRKTHGGMSYRRPGSIGQSSYPSRVIKGMKMSGQYGNKQDYRAQSRDRQG